MVTELWSSQLLCDPEYTNSIWIVGFFGMDHLEMGLTH